MCNGGSWREIIHIFARSILDNDRIVCEFALKIFGPTNTEMGWSSRL